MPRLHVIGAGGHAKVVIATARSSGFTDIVVVDDNPARVGTQLLGLTVAAGSESVLADPTALVVLAIGANLTRRRLAAHARCQFATLVHASALVDETVTLGAGTVVFAGAIIQPDTTVGTHCIINTAASIDHDCVLGHGVHVAPGTRLAGNVTLGNGVMLGIGTVCVPGVSIGDDTTVGAGAAVIHSLPAGVTAVGVPARPLLHKD